MRRQIYLLFLLAMLAIPMQAQLKLVPESFKQISNLDASNPNEWGDIDAHLLKREDKTDENGVKNALVKLNVDKITHEDMRKLEFITDQGVFVRWIQKDNTPGQMWLLISGVRTSFQVLHPIFGESNRMELDLKGLCSYSLNLTNNETTTLTILSEPEGANIYLDGQWMGNANKSNGCILKQVTYGKHKLRAELDDVVDELDIEVSEASQRSYKLEVYKERQFTITSYPAGATVYVDGQEVGVSPLTLPLKLKYHLVEARLDGQYDKFEAKFDERMSNTIQLEVVKHKSVQIAAIRAGRDVDADVYVDDDLVGTTPHTADLSYGSHDLQVVYGSKIHRKRIKVNDNSDIYYRFKFSTKNHFTWWWDKEYKVRPVGLSVGYVQKRWVWNQPDENVAEFHTDFWGEDKYIPGIQAGVRIQPQFKYGFGMSTGLFYEYYLDKCNDQTGTDDMGYSYTYDAKYQEHSLYIPINLEYRFTLAKNFSLFVNGGISMDVGLAGSIMATAEGEDQPYYKEEHIYGASDDWTLQKRFNLSYEFGGGIQIFGVQMSFNVAKGLLEHSSEEGLSMKVDKPMMISLAYVFGGD